MRLAFSLAPLFALAACQSAQTTDDAAVPHSAFPNAERLSAPIESPRWSTEPARDKAHEADDVMAAVHVAPGMTVADIGAGEGYYTIHLAPKVGKKGRVVAEDIEKDYVATLADRIARDRLDNVSVKLGVPEDPMLPAHSFDRIFMIHMYHEIASPFEFLWRMRPALNDKGEVDVVDVDRPTQAHGTPPALLICEFGQVGYKLVALKDMPSAGGYLARFHAKGDRPAPDQIKACSLGATPPPAAGATADHS